MEFPVFQTGASCFDLLPPPPCPFDVQPDRLPVHKPQQQSLIAYHVHVQNLVEQDAAAVAPAQAPPQEVEVDRAQARPWGTYSLWSCRCGLSSSIENT